MVHNADNKIINLNYNHCSFKQNCRLCVHCKLKVLEKPHKWGVAVKPSRFPKQSPMCSGQFNGPCSLNLQKHWFQRLGTKKATSFLREALTIKKLVPRVCIVVQFVYLHAPYRLLICDTRELIATPIYRQRAYEKKQCLYRNLVLISSL